MENNKRLNELEKIDNFHELKEILNIKEEKNNLFKIINKEDLINKEKNNINKI